MIPIRKVPLAAVVAALAGAGSSPQPFYHTLW